MPIKPENRSKYPVNWREISDAIRFDRAGSRCECAGECGLHNGKRCTEKHGKPAQYAKGRVILTVAHLNHDEVDCRPENLKAMCQRCHLRYDRELHKHNSALTRRQKKLNYELFPIKQRGSTFMIDE